MRHRWGWEPTCVFVGHTSGAHGERKLCGADHTLSCGSDGHRGCTAKSLANRDRCDVECGRNRWLGRHLKCGCLDRASVFACIGYTIALHRVDKALEKSIVSTSVHTKKKPRCNDWKGDHLASSHFVLVFVIVCFVSQ